MEDKGGLRQAQPERTGSERRTRARWARDLAAFRRAEAELATFRRYEAALPAAARAFPACGPLEDRFGDLDSARLAALRRLLGGAAPDLPALAVKIALAVDHEAWELARAETCLAALKADADRLIGAATS